MPFSSHKKLTTFFSLLELHTYRYSHTVNIQQAVTQDRSGTAREDPCVTRSHSFAWHQHTNLSLSVLAAAWNHCPWLVLIAHIHEGMARLSWPLWPLVTYRDKRHVPGIEPVRGDFRPETPNLPTPYAFIRNFCRTDKKTDRGPTVHTNKT